MRSLATLLFVLLFTSYGLCQNLDSLKSIVVDEDIHDTVKIQTLYWLAYEYQASNMDSFFYYSNLSLEISTATNYKQGTAESNFNIAIYYYLTSNLDSALIYYNKAYNLFSELNRRFNLARVCSNISTIYIITGDYDAALKYLSESYKYKLELNDSLGISKYHLNVGHIYTRKSDYPKALENYLKAKEIVERIHDKKGMSMAYSSIASIYKYHDDYKTAMKYHLKSLKIKEEINDIRGKAVILANIGNINCSMDAYDDAIIYFNQSLEIKRKLKDKRGIASTLLNIAASFHNLEKYDTALVLGFQALKMYEETGDSLHIAHTLFSIGESYAKIGQVKKGRDMVLAGLKIKERLQDIDGMALGYGDLARIEYNAGNFVLAKNAGLKAQSYGTKIGDLAAQRTAHEILSVTFAKLGDFEKAFKYHVFYKEIDDSLQNDEDTRNITKMQLQYGFGQKLLADSILRNAQAKIIEAERQRKAIEEQATLSRQRTYTYAGIAACFLLGIIVFILFRSNNERKAKNKKILAQKKEVEKQKEALQLQNNVIAEKNKEILDSINYAKRIQNAILPPKRVISDFLKQSFILYKPKDIVSGDFYWFEVVNQDTDRYIYYAAADCTGHGVPGAMVSVMCSNALTHVVKELNIVEPCLILDKVSEILEQKFSSSDEDVQDGMDLALCRLELQSNQLIYAGANNPLWIINKTSRIPLGDQGRKMDEGAYRLHEIKPDKQPIGRYDYRKPFQQHVMQLEKGDSIYVFSDGFPDQFGGPKGKKYKYKPFMKLILSLQNECMAEQHDSLSKEFETWRGELQQIDDVCIIGVKI